VTVALLSLGVVFFEKREHSAPSVQPKSHDPQGVCGVADNCFDCVIQDTCGFLGNRTSGFCLKGGHDDYEDFTGKIPKGYTWEFSRCLGSVQKDLGWAALAALMLYLMCFAPGLASMPWTINSEIYPTKVRAVAVSIATTVNWIFNLVVSMTFLNLATAITPFGSFGVYAAAAVLGGVFLYFRLPETKGKTLEEIQELFEA
jgi:SP family myo-inositol transporter-like MFS transporter 13